jgi:hypothetical protein
VFEDDLPKRKIGVLTPLPVIDNGSHGTAKVSTGEEEPQRSLPLHENVRGSRYYAN